MGKSILFLSFRFALLSQGSLFLPFKTAQSGFLSLCLLVHDLGVQHCIAKRKPKRANLDKTGKGLSSSSSKEREGEGVDRETVDLHLLPPQCQLEPDLL